MSFSRYPKYKDSGVEWLGKVPEHWGVTALKRGYDVVLGKMLQPESSGPDDELLPYLRAANIKWDGVDASDIKQMWLSKRDRTQLRLERGDLLVSEGGDVGRSCLWADELEECYFQNSVNRVRAFGGQSNRYLYYWISTIKDKGYIDVLCNKSTIAHFTAEKVAAVPVLFPPSTEQIRIAEFLDHETAKIDALMTEQERLMELLKEKRQAVIAHAVTKGINPKAPMKDSGIRWLGEVPAHWEVVQSRRLFHARNEPAQDTDQQLTASQKYGMLPQTEFVELEGRRVVEIIKGTESLRHAEPNDFIISLRSFQGGIEWCKISGAVTFHYVVLVPVKHVHPPFFAHLFKSIAYIQALRSTTNLIRDGQDLRYSHFVQVDLPVVPMAEQKAIAEFINQETAKFDALSAEAQCAIDLLQERRTALISAAVTGQIDVRNH
jgi:type I restriction enzyme S subunit